MFLKFRADQALAEIRAPRGQIRPYSEDPPWISDSFPTSLVDLMRMLLSVGPRTCPLCARARARARRAGRSQRIREVLPGRVCDCARDDTRAEAALEALSRWKGTGAFGSAWEGRRANGPGRPNAPRPGERGAKVLRVGGWPASLRSSVL